VLTPPVDLFCRLEAIVLETPKLLDQHHYHTLPTGREAFTVADILHPDTAHCLMGWVAVLTPEAVERQSQFDDCYDYAQTLLKRSGRLPIPWGIAFADEESAIRVIRGRAAEEKLGL
jgi:hypothetical protein